MNYQSCVDSAVEPLVITCSKLTVVHQPIDITIKFPDNLTVKESAKLKLSCLLSRRPIASMLAKVKMLKDDKPLSLSSREKPTRYELVDNADRQLTFMIERAQLDDTGKYTLVLGEGISTTTCNVKVVPDDESGEQQKPVKAALPPRIIQDLNPSEPIEALTTEPFKIDGLVVQGDDLKVEWYHDGKKVLPLTNQVLIDKANESANVFNLALNFEKPFMSDGGKYYCVISNAHGMAKSKEATVQMKGINFVFISTV